MNFNALHQQNTPLLLANVWDASSAQRAQQAGYQALGTSSAAIAATMGYLDGECMPFAELLFLVQRIKSATHLPLSVDLEAGYSRDPQLIAAHIQKLAQLGVVGVNLEDSLVTAGRRILRPVDEFTATIAQVRVSLREQDCEIFLNIRTDGYVLALADARSETILRGQRYHAAGADGLFVPGITAVEDIAAVVAGVELPINVMSLPSLPDFQVLQQLGVKRISMGNFVFDRLQQQLSELFVAIRCDQSFTRVFEYAHQ
ncbi:isocitrate lyase/phosphoenolpyruvate mutase family protein [Chitinibacter sp. SCUT-21]|uniref:isocitrate lyase/PEP mutase family protein n=1 Tax=Chitinibacter sp. SCUT-21 TaxID=2970891 RepID=UPI0035A708F0